ncbi:MAG: hypothetical protein K2J65_03350 [Duncaniella sp.]|nr:hypothetical protein [Duncaniella sp.]
MELSVFPLFPEPLSLLQEEVEYADYDEGDSYDTEVIQVVALLEFRIADVTHHPEVD